METFTETRQRLKQQSIVQAQRNAEWLVRLLCDSQGQPACLIKLGKPRTEKATMGGEKRNLYTVFFGVVDEQPKEVEQGEGNELTLNFEPGWAIYSYDSLSDWNRHIETEAAKRYVLPVDTIVQRETGFEVQSEKPASYIHCLIGERAIEAWVYEDAQKEEIKTQIREGAVALLASEIDIYQLNK